MVLCADNFYRRNPDEDAKIQVMRWWQGISHRNQGSGSGIDIEEIIEENPPAEIKEYLKVVRQCVWNRRTFRGYKKCAVNSSIAGLVPQRARIGDELCILYGCSVPVVLRKVSKKDEGVHWRLIGEAYVHNVMDGEALSSLSPEMRSSEEMEFDIR